MSVTVQIDGRTRGQIELPRGASQAEAVQAALQSDAICRHLRGAVPLRVIYRENRLLNLVVS